MISFPFLMDARTINKNLNWYNFFKRSNTPRYIGSPLGWKGVLYRNYKAFFGKFLDILNCSTFSAIRIHLHTCQVHWWSGPVCDVVKCYRSIDFPIMVCLWLPDALLQVKIFTAFISLSIFLVLEPVFCLVAIINLILC